MTLATVIGGSSSHVQAPDQGGYPATADKVHLSLSSYLGQNRGVYRGSLPRLMDGDRWFGVRRAGRLFELQSAGDSCRIGRAGGGRRSAVGGFSWASRRRLLKAIGSIAWGAVGDRWFVTLTYPGVFPTDGRDAKADLQAFRKRLVRRFGAPFVLVWKMEFQRRGAVHFHLLLPAYEGVDLELFKSWVSSAWFGVVKSGDLRHLEAGTQVQVARTDCARYFSYALNDKSYQNRVPENFSNCGRFWGIWGYRPEWCGALLSESEFTALRRAVAAWSKSRGRPLRFGSRYQGGWYLTDNADGGFVLARLLRAVDRDLFPLLV